MDVTLCGVSLKKRQSRRELQRRVEMAAIAWGSNEMIQTELGWTCEMPI